MFCETILKTIYLAPFEAQEEAAFPNNRLPPVNRNGREQTFANEGAWITGVGRVPAEPPPETGGKMLPKCRAL